MKIRLLILVLFFVFLCTSTTVSFAASSTTNPSDSIIKINANWQYRWGDSPIDANGKFVWQFDENIDNQWKSSDEPDAIENRPLMPNGKAQDLIWYRMQLPDQDCNDCAVWFKTIDKIYDVFYAGKPLTSFGHIQPGNIVPFNGDSLNLIRLPEHSSGKWITIRVQSDSRFIGISNEVYVGAYDRIVREIILESSLMVISGLFSIAVGALVLLVSFFYPEITAMRWFGGFACGYGIVNVFDQKFLLYLFPQQSWMTLILLYGYFIVSITFIGYMRALFGNGPLQLLRWLQWLMSISLISMFITQQFELLPPAYWVDNLLPVNYLILLVLISIVLANFLRHGNVERKWFIYGILFFLFTASIDVISRLNELSPKMYFQIIGMLVFYAVQMYIIGKRMKNKSTSQDGSTQSLKQQSQELLETNQKLSEQLTQALRKEHESGQNQQKLSALMSELFKQLHDALVPIKHQTEQLVQQMAVNLPYQQLSLFNALINRVNTLYFKSILWSNQAALKDEPALAVSLYNVIQRANMEFVRGDSPVYISNQIEPQFTKALLKPHSFETAFRLLLITALSLTNQGAVTVSAHNREKQIVISVRFRNGNHLCKLFVEPTFAESIPFGQSNHSDLDESCEVWEFHQLVRILSNHGKIELQALDTNTTEWSIKLTPANDQIEEFKWNESEAQQVELVARNQMPIVEQKQKVSSPITITVKPTNRILVVDDEQINCQALMNLLEAYDYEVICASDGFEALQILDRQPNFDLILLDVMMPRISGYEVCQRIRQTYDLLAMPIVLLTAKNTINDLLKGFESGANEFLTKPFSKQELLARIRVLIQASVAYRQTNESLRAAIENPWKGEQS